MKVKKSYNFVFFIGKKKREANIFGINPGDNIDISAHILVNSKIRKIYDQEPGFVINSPFRIEWQNGEGERKFDIQLFNDGTLFFRKFTFKDGRETNKIIIEKHQFKLKQGIINDFNIHVTSTEEKRLTVALSGIKGEDDVSVTMEIPREINLKDITQIDILKIDPSSKITVYESGYVKSEIQKNESCLVM